MHCEVSADIPYFHWLLNQISKSHWLHFFILLCVIGSTLVFCYIFLFLVWKSDSISIQLAYSHYIFCESLQENVQQKIFSSWELSDSFYSFNSVSTLCLSSLLWYTCIHMCKYLPFFQYMYKYLPPFSAHCCDRTFQVSSIVGQVWLSAAGLMDW